MAADTAQPWTGAGAFRPSEEIRELRKIQRQKLVLVREQADWLRRMQKSLDEMNVAVHRAVRQLKGASGMAMLRAIVGGERDPRKLVELCDPGCKKGKAEMIELLGGSWRSGDLYILKRQLKSFDDAGEEIKHYEQEIQQRLGQLTPAERKETPVPPVAKKGEGEGDQKAWSGGEAAGTVPCDWGGSDVDRWSGCRNG
jgi:hypothetical protein